MKNPRLFPRLAFLLAALVAVAYGPFLGLPFIGDDYVFLDRTRAASFNSLWSTANVQFGWYRPWSREFHFWLLQHSFGLNALSFRVFGVILWIVALCLYGLIVERLASTRVALLATVGTASLALWGTPLLWISGSQDLWMLCFVLASLLLFISERIWWALLPFGLALLSKETAGILPGILCASLMIVRRRSLPASLQRTAHFWALLAAWFLFHPTLHARLFTAAQHTQELEHRPVWPILVAKTLLSVFNLNIQLHLPEFDLPFALRSLGSLALVTFAALAVLRRTDPSAAWRNTAGRVPAVNRLAAVWMLMGWFPLILPSIGWHAYYGCLGALGAWLLIALWLESRPRHAVVGVACLSILGSIQANTLSWDWGDMTYLRRAGSTLAAIRVDLVRQHPRLPPNTRVYVYNVPNNIGLIAGDSPAMRVWYGDSTLRAGFYSYYRPRRAGAPGGSDLFFRFDSSAGMVEITPGPEDVRQGLQANQDWEADHEDLIYIFIHGGDLRRAAVELEKLSTLRHRAAAAGYAAVCWQALGDSLRADSLIAASTARLQLSPTQSQAWIARLRQLLARSVP